jgi:hypothetical protein
MTVNKRPLIQVQINGLIDTLIWFLRSITERVTTRAKASFYRVAMLAERKLTVFSKVSWASSVLSVNWY